jgi:hypothetical protein
MSILEWDKIGERFFETGIDRGVLYTVDGAAVPWNGLTNVAENTTSEVKEFWLDGVKYLDHHVPGSYSAKMEAFTYPDVLDELTGIALYAPGVYLHDQKAKIFHLSYRTRVGNDIDSELGYKIHVIYNVMALAAAPSMSTIGENVEPSKFSWDLSGTPPQMFGARPTAHIHLDSRELDPTLLEDLEILLYGSEETDPNLPLMVDLLALIEGS